MLALATTQEGERPLVLPPLSGTSSEKRSIRSALEAIPEQWRASDEEPSGSVADHGVFRTATRTRLKQAGVTWRSRVSETMSEANVLREEGSEDGQPSDDGMVRWVCRQGSLPQGEERWVVRSPQASVERVRQRMMRPVIKAQKPWASTSWHGSPRRLACEADARAAWEGEQKGTPTWLDLHHELLSHPISAGQGRPRNDASPTRRQWQIKASVSITVPHVMQDLLRNVCGMVGTHILSPPQLSDQALRETSNDQGSVERGCRLRNDPLFLASSVCVTKPERIVALSLIMVWCWLVFRLAACRLRQRLAETAHTIPDPVNTPTARPPMRWVFPLLEGMALLPVQTASASRTLVFRLQPVHPRIVALLGPLSETCSLSSGCNCGMWDKADFCVFLTVCDRSFNLLPMLLPSSFSVNERPLARTPDRCTH